MRLTMTYSSRKASVVAAAAGAGVTATMVRQGTRMGMRSMRQE